MAIYRVSVKGVDGPGSRDLGLIEAAGKDAAIRKAARIHYPNAQGSDFEYITGCITAVKVGEG